MPLKVSRFKADLKELSNYTNEKTITSLFNINCDFLHGAAACSQRGRY